MRRFIERFREMCERVSDRTMIVYGQDALSYAQVDEESARVYRYLKEHGIGRECFVHVFMPKRAHFASAMIGVWKAGCALMLTEDTYPADRVRFMRNDLGCALVLDQELFDHIMAECQPLAGHEDVDDHDAAYEHFRTVCGNYRYHEDCDTQEDGAGAHGDKIVIYGLYQLIH